MPPPPSAPANPPAGRDLDPGLASGDRDGTGLAAPSPVSVPARVSGIAEWALSRLGQGRVCWTVLSLGMAASVALSLWLTRGVTFHADDFLYFVANRGFDLKVLLGPHNGHLIFVPRLMYAVGLKLFGARHYVVFRLLEAIGIALVAGLFFALASRRVGARAALAPSILLLFLGSAWNNSLDPGGTTHVYCVAAGLGALLALDRPSRRGDLAACVLLTVSVATFSLGLAFLVGVAVSVVLREDRARRAWIFLVPLAIYAAWFFAPKLSTPPFTTATGATAANVLLIPSGVAQAAAAVSAAVTGLSYDFSNPASFLIDSPWGYVVAAVAVAALILRLRRGALPMSLWTSLSVLLAYWASLALATHFTAEPNENRYIYDGAVLALFVAADALVGIRLSRAALMAVYAAAVFALATNIALLRVGGGFIRGGIPSDRAELAAIEIARDHVSSRFVPQGEPELALLDGIVGGSGPYLAAVARNGSFAFTLPELRRQPEQLRELADATLASALQLRLAVLPALPVGAKCLPIDGQGPAGLTVRAPGIVLRSASPQAVVLGRFGMIPTARVGELSPGSFDLLRIPADRAPDLWHLSLARPVTVCDASDG